MNGNKNDNNNGELNRLLLGDNPFLGVNHLSQEKARQKAQGNSRYVPEVIKAAFESGAQGFTFSTHPTIYEALKVLKEEGYDRHFGLYPIIPAAEVYVREAAQKGLSGLMMETLGRMGWADKTKAILGGGLSLLTKDPKRMLKTFLETEIALCSKVTPKNAELKVVFLHEIICDVALSFQMSDLLTEIVLEINEKYKASAGFVTRNFASYVNFLNETGIARANKIVIMTPFNKAGFQMTPSREKCEAALSSLDSKSSKVIAMSTLAAGLLGLEESVEYLKTQPRLDSFTIGVSSAEHARRTFSLYSSELGKT